MIFVTVLSLFIGSGNCSGEVDLFTNLTYCELHDIKRQIHALEVVKTLPADFDSIDTSTINGRKRKHALFLSWRYEIVSRVCFDNDLSVGAYRPGDGSFICINEGK